MARTSPRPLPHRPSGITLVLLVLSGFALGLAMAGCSDERTAGASTETTNGFSGQTLDADGHPAIGARVRIWDPQGDRILAEATSGPDGHWTVPGIEAPVVGIQVSTADDKEGAWKGGQRTLRDSTNPLVVRTSAFASLLVVNQKLSRLAGTPWRTTDGLFRSVPPGSFSILSDTSATSFPTGSIRLAPEAAESLATARDSGLLVEDFDDGDSTWIYGPVRDNSARWFTQVSPSGAALLKPLSAESTATPGMVRTGAYRGRSLRMQYYVADTGAFAQAGIYFRGLLDLSALRSLRVKAKGNGILRMGLYGWGIEGKRVQWQVSPDSVWREYTFRPGSEMASGPSDPPRTTFEDLKPRVFLVMIQAYGGSELWIDDIRFDGITPEMVIP